MSEPLLDHTALDGQLAGLSSTGRWYVGFSGGVDSTVLLHLLHRWCAANPGAPALCAIHINHGLQAAADDWQAHCEWICKFLHIECISWRVTPREGGSGTEAAAREARYQAFEAQLEAGDVLFLGHHLDDQVETFLLRLLRGAGVHGLAAMPARRPLGTAQLVRPLLPINRTQLEDYARHQGLECVEDPTNSHTEYDRNFLRAELLPLLATRWPGYRQTVARASEHMAGTARALEQALPRPDTLTSVMDDPGLPLAALLTETLEAAALKLRSWLQGQNLQPPDQALLDEFLRQLREASAQARPQLQCSAYTLQRYRQAVYLLPAPAPDIEPFELAPGERYEIPGVGIVGLETAEGGGLWLAAGERVELAWRRGGERCQPVGRSASNSLKKLLQAEAVPPWWRDRVPLLYLDGELLAVGGLGPCESTRWRKSAARRQTLWQLSWERTAAIARQPRD